jgi:hypothetical protein
LEGYFSVPHDDPPKWLLMLTAYIDETGQQGDSWGTKASGRGSFLLGKQD